MECDWDGLGEQRDSLLAYVLPFEGTDIFFSVK